MTKRDRKRLMIEFYGQDAYDTAVMLVRTSDPDGAWAMAMDEGLEDVAEIIEELFMENDDV